MLDKMIGVSPPPKGEAPDSKPALSKELRTTSKSDYKKDFEKALQKKLNQEKEDSERKEVGRKESKDRDEELRADKKEKKSLGGTKKRVTEDEDKMISNVMASIESKVEIPDSKIEDPAEIKVDITQKASFEPVLAGMDLLQDAHQASNANAQQEAQSAPVAMQAIEAELGAEVDFKSDAGVQQSSKELAQKLKAFDAEKAPVSEKSQNFEQSVLERLQKDLGASAGAMAQSSDNKDQGGSEQKNSEQSKDLKAELAGPNQLHQSAGQSHGEFKAQMAAHGAQAADSTSLSQLEDKRDANINEIMNRAQYLVKKGGGEMSVRMTPEGLGEVHLRVLLQDGKLNIEMQTQDKDVKKLIEESLSDLKSGLAAHRLSLEHVKVDTVNAANTDNNTQFQSNLNQGGSHQHSREFSNDFQGSMNQQSRHRSSESQNEISGVTPLSPRTSAVASALRTYGGTKGATVNRVA